MNSWIAEAQALASEHVNRLTVAIQQYEQTGITTEVDMQRANEILGSVAAARRMVEEKWEVPVKAANTTHKILTGLRKRGTDLFDSLRARIEKPMKTYIKQQEELARQRQREADEAAAELKKRQEAEARRLARQGDVAGAREAKAVAQAITAPVMPGPEIKLDGTTLRRPWIITIFDPLALVKAIAEGQAPIEVIREFNEVYLKRRASEINQEGIIYPGVRAKQDIGFGVKV